MVGVGVIVAVGVMVGVRVAVEVGVTVTVAVLVGVLVAVAVGVAVGMEAMIICDAEPTASALWQSEPIRRAPDIPTNPATLRKPEALERDRQLR